MSRRSATLSPTGPSPSVAPLIQRSSARVQICNLPRNPYSPEDMSHNPISTTDTAYHVLMVWADPRSLAATSGVAFCFLLLRLLRCFNSPGSLYWPMYSARNCQGLPDRVSPFGNPRISLSPATRGLSQVATSFFVSRCQGIHHAPLVAWPKTTIHLTACALLRHAGPLSGYQHTH